MQAVIDENILADVLDKEYKEHGDKVSPLRIPKDKYFLCHMVFFLMGIAHLLPMSFLNAAQNYWMYKFRNLSDPTMSAGNRTSLQTHFASTQMIVNTTPMLVIGIWNIVYGHRVKILSRIIYTFIVEVLIYYLLTIFVKINTDDCKYNNCDMEYQVTNVIEWLASETTACSFPYFCKVPLRGAQGKEGLYGDLGYDETAFFVMVMISWGLLTGANSINIVASSLLYPRFPHSYMKTCIIGEGMAGIVGDVLNIISVAAFDDVRDSTFMYFICGSGVVTLTFVMVMVVSRTEFFMHCVESMPQDHKAGMPPKKDIFKVMYKIRLTVFVFLLTIIGLSATHTSITSLVVSEQDNTKWATKFFAPVVTFFWSDFCGMTGRLLATHSPLRRLPDIGLYILSFLRTIAFVPLLWFCNAQPRSHLSVLFPHDYQYAIILGLFMVVNGFLMNVAMLSVPKKTTKKEAEIAYTVFSLVMGVITTITSPIGTIIVDVL